MSDDILKLINDKVDKLDSKIDSISGDIVHIKITSAKHEENLKLHMRRSDLAEEGINLLKEELIPLKKHVSSVDSVVKFMMLASTFVGTVLGFLRFFKKI